MIKTSFRSAYKKDGGTGYPDTRKKSGVYLIANKKNEIVYVGYSETQLYKTMYRHFESWNDKTQTRAVFPRKGYKIRVVLCTPKQAIKLEKALILKHKPKGNPDKLTDYILTKPEQKIKDDYSLVNVTNIEDVPF